MKGKAAVLSLMVVATVLMSVAVWGTTVYYDLDKYQVENMLDSVDYRIDYDRERDSHGDPCWRIEDEVSDLAFTLYVYDDDENNPDEYESLLCRAGFGMSDGPQLWNINGWNQQKRFSRAFLDDEMDPIVEADLDLEGGVTEQTVEDYLERFIRILRGFADYIGFD